MKTSNYFFVIIFSTILWFVPFMLKSQSISTAISKDNWRPIKIQSDGKNSMNGVDFYRKPSECNSERVVIIKAINTNSFPVRINWKENNEIKKSIVIPASSEMEGNCNSQKQLIIPKSQIDKEGTTKRQLLSHLEVTEVKN
mgnify:CR=1 FL=1